MWTPRRAVAVPGLWLILTSSTTSDELLAMRVSARVPGSLTIHLTVKADAENRTLVVSAESPDFYRSSQIQLNGKSAPRSNVLELEGLPTSVYEVTGVLIGSKGPRAEVIRIARVLPDGRGR